MIIKYKNVGCVLQKWEYKADTDLVEKFFRCDFVPNGKYCLIINDGCICVYFGSKDDVKKVIRDMLNTPPNGIFEITKTMEDAK